MAADILLGGADTGREGVVVKVQIVVVVVRVGELEVDIDVRLCELGARKRADAGRLLLEPDADRDLLIGVFTDGEELLVRVGLDLGDGDGGRAAAGGVDRGGRVGRVVIGRHAVDLRRTGAGLERDAHRVRDGLDLFRSQGNIGIAVGTVGDREDVGVGKVELELM